MYSHLSQFLIENYSLLPNELGQKLLFYIIFEQRFHHKFHIPFDPSVPLEGRLPALFRNIRRYDLKDASIVLDSAIPWRMLQENESLSKILNHLRAEISQASCATVEWIQTQISEILELDGSIFGIDVTPPSIRKLISLLAAQNSPQQIIELCSGTYLLGLQLWQTFGCSEEISCLGEEINAYLCAVSRVFLFLCDVDNFSIRECNIADPPQYPEQDKNAPVIYVADLPLAGNRTFPMNESDPLFSKKVNLYSDWLFIRTICNRMCIGDRAYLIVTKGALVRKNERFLREELVANNFLRAVIKLPIGLYSSHTLPMNILVLEKSAQTQPNVFFADLSSCGVPSSKSRRVQEISDSAIDKTVALFRSLKSENGFSKIVSSQRIQTADYSLYPPVYLNSSQSTAEQVRLGEIASVIRGLQITKDYPVVANGNRYLLNIRDIHDNEFFYDAADRIMEGSSLWEFKYRIQEDDIVLTSKGSTLKILIVPPDPPPAYISSNLTILRVDKSRYSPYVLYEYLTSDSGISALSLIQTGTTVRVLGSNNLEQLFIPVCEYEKAIELGSALKKAALDFREKMYELKRTYTQTKNALCSQLNHFK